MRLPHRAQTLQRWRSWCFFGGLATIGLALQSPLATYSGHLFFLHMIEHMLLMVIAPLLLLLGAPLLPMLWALPKNMRRPVGLLFAPCSMVHRVFHLLTAPGMTLTVYVVVLAVWHLPVMYDAAQGPTVIHELEHLICWLAHISTSCEDWRTLSA